MKAKKYEKGQALIIIVFAIIGLVALTGLAVDGGRTFVDRQSAQNSADSAALGAALAKVKGQDISARALGIAATNGYVNNTTHDTITVTNPITDATTDCKGQAIRSEYRSANYVHVKIVTNVNAYFAPVVGIKETHNCVEAIAKAKPSSIVPLFDGNAVVGLKPSGDSVYINGNANWTLHGGGAYANSDFNGKCNKPFNLDPGKAVTAHGTVNCDYSGVELEGLPQVPYPTDFTDQDNPVVSIMPPTPPCNGTADGGYVVPSSPSSFTFSNGVYCVSNFDAFNKKDIVLNNAVLYVTDTSFSIKFAGGGGFAGTGRTTGPYAGFYMVIAFANPGNQEIEWRGNSSTDGIYGTILAPSTTIDYRGNSYGLANHSQLIAYEVQTLGTADIIIDYVQEENRRISMPPTVELIR